MQSYFSSKPERRSGQDHDLCEFRDWTCKGRQENRSPEQFLREHGVHLDLWKDSENPERNDNMPDFYDVLYIDAEHIIDASSSPTLIRVEFLISRAEYGHDGQPGYVPPCPAPYVHILHG